jgi:hypothetical protein
MAKRDGENSDPGKDRSEKAETDVNRRAGLRPDERDPDEPPGPPGSAGRGVNMAGTPAGGAAAGSWVAATSAMARLTTPSSKTPRAPASTTTQAIPKPVRGHTPGEPVVPWVVRRQANVLEAAPPITASTPTTLPAPIRPLELNHPQNARSAGEKKAANPVSFMDMLLALPLGSSGCTTRAAQPADGLF